MPRTSAFGSARVALIQFPGSNCDRDCSDSLSRHFGITCQYVWHRDTSLPPVDAVILPGGFSYGDYVRSGVLASISPIMSAVKAYVSNGGWVIGICNGFQILTESGLLPGALVRNESGRFICRRVGLQVASSGISPLPTNPDLSLPIAHGQGCYFASSADLDRIAGEGQIALTYIENPNGSKRDIAGICSENGRILGMMPHPERACDKLLGSADGLFVWESFLAGALGS